MDRFVQEMHKLQITEVVMIKSGAPVGLKSINELKYVDWLWEQSTSTGLFDESL